MKSKSKVLARDACPVACDACPTWAEVIAELEAKNAALEAANAAGEGCPTPTPAPTAAICPDLQHDGQDLIVWVPDSSFEYCVDMAYWDYCYDLYHFLLCPTSCAEQYAEAGIVCGEDLGDPIFLEFVLYFGLDESNPQSCADASILCQIDDPTGVAVRALCPETCNGAIICTDLDDVLFELFGSHCDTTTFDVCADAPFFCPTYCAAEYAEAGGVCGEDLGDLTFLDQFPSLDGAPQSCAEASSACLRDDAFGVAIRAWCPETCDDATAVPTADSTGAPDDPNCLDNEDFVDAYGYTCVGDWVGVGDCADVPENCPASCGLCDTVFDAECVDNEDYVDSNGNPCVAWSWRYSSMCGDLIDVGENCPASCGLCARKDDGP